MSHTVTSRELVRQVPTQNRLFSRFISLGTAAPNTPILERTDKSMNRNHKRKTCPHRDTGKTSRR